MFSISAVPRRILCLTLAGCAAAVLHAPPVWAQDAESSDAVDSAPPGDYSADPSATSFTLDDLGLGTSTVLSNGRVQLTIPIPTGVAPSTLNATLAVPAWVGRGWIDIESDGTPITRLDVEDTAQIQPVSIPLGAAPVIDNAVTLDVTSTLIPDAGYCPDIERDHARLLGASVDFAGLPTAPRTIAEFLPPILRQLTVFVPSEPDSTVIEAALQLTTSLVQHYGAQSVQIIVRRDSELQGAEPDGPYERSVVLSENSDPGAELIYPLGEQTVPRLFISGAGGALTDQARLITSSVAPLAVTTRATAGVATPPAVLPSDSITLDELGVGAASGSPSASVVLDQTRLGRSAGEMSIRLTGTYSPGPGSLRASIGDRTVDVWPADDSGVLDRIVVIPDHTVERVTTLTVSVEHPATGAACRSDIPAVTVDGASVIESSASASAVPLGFGSLPQALMPGVTVALSSISFTDTVRAVTIVGGLQRMSTRSLMPTVLSVDEAVSGTDPAIVIAADGALPDTLDLPLSSASTATFSATDAVNDRQATILTLDTDIPHATLQATQNSAGAAMLVATSNAAPEQLDGLLTWLGANPSRWFGLSGDVLFGASGVAPLALTSSDFTGAQTAAASSDSALPRAIVVVGVTVGVLLFAAGIATAIVVVVRARRSAVRHSRGHHSS